MNICPLRSRVGAYYDHEMPAGEWLEMQAHLGHCAACQGELAGLERLSAQLQSVALPPATADVWGHLQNRIAQQNERGLLHTAYSLLALAASLFVVVSLWVQQMNINTASQPVTSWELTAVNYPTEASANASLEVATAQWIFEDLSRRDDDE